MLAIKYPNGLTGRNLKQGRRKECEIEATTVIMLGTNGGLGTRHLLFLHRDTLNNDWRGGPLDVLRAYLINQSAPLFSRARHKC